MTPKEKLLMIVCIILSAIVSVTALWWAWSLLVALVEVL
jgi:cell division protein FtsL